MRRESRSPTGSPERRISRPGIPGEEYWTPASPQAPASAALVTASLLLLVLIGTGFRCAPEVSPEDPPLVTAPQADVDENGAMRCPVTGELVTPDREGAVAYVYEGRTYLFRDDEAFERFKADPERYLPPAPPR